MLYIQFSQDHMILSTYYIFIYVTREKSSLYKQGWGKGHQYPYASFLWPFETRYELN